MKTLTINSKGQWLRSGAAKSYLRMIAAGMPEGGISGMGAGRTRADQAALYDAYLHHGGNLAARPGTSAHETGKALDLNTGEAAQKWASEGGNYKHVRAGESVQANAFGWFRTVPSEPWHFQYFPAKDKYRLRPFPLPEGWFFGPELPLSRKRSVSGKYRYGIRLRQWQTQARMVGLDVDVTGIYDAKTEAAARKLQADAGVTVDGLIGPATWPLPWKLTPPTIDAN